MIERLSRALSLRDEETGRHIERMSRYAASLATRVGYSGLTPDEFRMAAALHDVGKIGVTDTILLKPGELAPDERAAMQRHSSIGYQLLAGSSGPVMEAAARIALGHHEWWDGSGYPRGLKGGAIPEEARIAAIADVFDAMTSPRVYKPALSIAETREFMTGAGRGTQFEPRLVDAFFEDLSEVMAIRQQFPEEERDERIRVFIVDDHEILVESLGRLLASQANVQLVGSARTAEEAVRTIPLYLPDVVLMDFDLPDGNGADTTDTIRALVPGVRVVMLTSWSDHETMSRAVAAGCSGFVSKGDTGERLMAAIVAAHDGEFPQEFVELRNVLNRLPRTNRGVGSDLRPRELEVLELMASGSTNKVIASELFLSVNTVRNHVQNIFYKLDVHSKLEAVARAVQEGILVRTSTGLHRR